MTFAIPKSAILHIFPDKRIFFGLISRWSIPFSWLYWTPLQI